VTDIRCIKGDRDPKAHALVAAFAQGLWPSQHPGDRRSPGPGPDRPTPAWRRHPGGGPWGRPGDAADTAGASLRAPGGPAPRTGVRGTPHDPAGDFPERRGGLSLLSLFSAARAGRERLSVTEECHLLLLSPASQSGSQSDLSDENRPQDSGSPTRRSSALKRGSLCKGNRPCASFRLRSGECSSVMYRFSQ
jgi:hypothetical protein